METKVTKKTRPYKVWFFKGNVKVGKMLTWNKLAGCTEIKGCKGTCGEHCTGCWNADNWEKSSCYVAKSYVQYKDTVLNAHIRNTEAIRKDMAEVFKDLDKQLKRVRDVHMPVRIHSSGEIESELELLHWMALAEANPTHPIYVYTKAYDIVDKIFEHDEKVCISNPLPKNFYLNISIWHENGIDCYNRWKKYPNVRAFAYDDGFDYAAHGLKLDGYCKAYDEKGKMDHKVTCDKCKKCFSKNQPALGCYSH